MNDQRKYKMQKSNVRQKIWYRSKNYGWLVYEYTSISYYSQHTPVFTVCKGKKVYCEKHIEWYMGCGMPVCEREAKIYPKKKERWSQVQYIRYTVWSTRKEVERERSVWKIQVSKNGQQSSQNGVEREKNAFKVFQVHSAIKGGASQIQKKKGRHNESRERLKGGGRHLQKSLIQKI